MTRPSEVMIETMSDKRVKVIVAVGWMKNIAETTRAFNL